jgi:hypothetical protein
MLLNVQLFFKAVSEMAIDQTSTVSFLPTWQPGSGQTWPDMPLLGLPWPENLGLKTLVIKKMNLKIL